MINLQICLDWRYRGKESKTTNTCTKHCLAITGLSSVVSCLFVLVLFFIFPFLFSCYCIVERFSFEFHTTKTKVHCNHSSQSQRTESIPWTNQKSKQVRVTASKRGKTSVSETRLVFLLIGWVGGTKFFQPITGHNEGNQSNAVCFDTQSKIALTQLELLALTIHQN